MNTKAFLITFFLLTTTYCFSQNNEYHTISSDPEIRKIIKQGLEFMHDNSKKNKNELAFKEFMKAALLDDKTAQFLIAEMCEKGLGTKKDLNTAFDWYLKSAENGDCYAMNKVGLFYKNGKIFDQNFDIAAEWFYKSAEAGNSVGKYLIAYMHYKGFGVEQNYSKAYELALQSSNEGIIAGSHLLAYCYEHGHGVAQDLDKAEALYKKCQLADYKQSKIRLEKVKNKKQNRGQTNKSASLNKDNKGDVTSENNYKEIKRNLDVNFSEFNGNWEGTIFFYDWAKSNISENSPLKLTILEQGYNINGNWKINNDSPQPFSATKVGNVLYCKNLILEQEGALGFPEKWLIKEGQFEKIEENGHLYLYGNLRVYNSAINEPCYPCNVVLKYINKENTDTLVTENKTLTEIVDIEHKLSLSEYSEIKAYPNPTSKSITINYTLSSDGYVQISLFNMSGQLVKVIKTVSLQKKGTYSFPQNIDGKPGTYIVRLKHNNKVYTCSIIKN